MNVFDQLRRDEGIRLKPYRDTVGKLTIGYGRNLDDEGITVPEAEFMLQNDVTVVVSVIDTHLPWAKNLDEVRRAVLINMAFNMGIYGLLQFKQTLMFVQSGNYSAAAKEMLMSAWASQVGARAQRLAKQMETGDWI